MKNLIFLLIFFFCGILSAQDTIKATFSETDIHDAYINQVYYVPSGSRQSLVASDWTYQNEEGIGRSLIYFDLTSIPEHVTVLDAKMNLFHDPISAHTGHSGYYNEGQVVRVAEPWKDQTVTWYNQPRTSVVNEIKLTPPQTSYQDYPDINITSLIQNIVDHKDDNYGFMLKLKDEDSIYNSLVFASVDHPYPELRPSLEVTYVEDTSQFTNVYIIQDTHGGVKNAYINSVVYSHQSNPTSLVCAVWTYDGDPGIGRSLLRFDLSSIPVDEEVYKAELTLYWNPYSAHIGHSRMGGLNNLLIQRVIEPWDENSVTWYNQPLTTDTNQVFLPPTNIGNEDYLNIDVTEMVKDILSDTAHNYGFLLRLENENEENMYRSLVFTAKENGIDSLCPKLEIYTRSYLSVKENPADNLLVYPNPVSSILHVNFKNGFGPYRITLYDNKSSFLLTKYVASGKISLNLSNYASGAYMLKVSTKYGVFSKVIIKK